MSKTLRRSIPLSLRSLAGGVLLSTQGGARSCYANPRNWDLTPESIYMDNIWEISLAGVRQGEVYSCGASMKRTHFSKYDLQFTDQDGKVILHCR